jgi:hypothetical protein
MKLLALCLALVAVAGTATVWVMWHDGWISAQWRSWRAKWRSPPAPEAVPLPVPCLEPTEEEWVEIWGEIPGLPDDPAQWDTTVQQRMDDIETVGERDGWRCGLCHTPADHLYFIELHDDGTLCCAVCAQILDAGAIE